MKCTRIELGWGFMRLQNEKDFLGWKCLFLLVLSSVEFMSVGSECEEELQEECGLSQLETRLQHLPVHVRTPQVGSITGECSRLGWQLTVDMLYSIIPVVMDHSTKARHWLSTFRAAIGDCTTLNVHMINFTHKHPKLNSLIWNSNSNPLFFQHAPHLHLHYNATTTTHLWKKSVDKWIHVMMFGKGKVFGSNITFGQMYLLHHQQYHCWGKKWKQVVFVSQNSFVHQLSTTLSSTSLTTLATAILEPCFELGCM